VWHTSNLDIWSFYRMESLAQGPSYDMERVDSELRDEDDDSEAVVDGLAALADRDTQRRRLLNGCYDNIELLQPAALSFVLSVSCSLVT